MPLQSSKGDQASNELLHCVKKLLSIGATRAKWLHLCYDARKIINSRPEQLQNAISRNQTAQTPDRSALPIMLPAHAFVEQSSSKRVPVSF
jgi:hypothetical protein